MNFSACNVKISGRYRNAFCYLLSLVRSLFLNRIITEDYMVDSRYLEYAITRIFATSGEFSVPFLSVSYKSTARCLGHSINREQTEKVLNENEVQIPISH